MKRIGILSVLIILLFSSCPVDNPFSEYDGTELLTGDEQAFTGWETAYTEEVPFNYIEFTEASAEAGTTQGLSDTDAAIYRLELVNLVLNGDFEETLNETTIWSYSGESVLGTTDSTGYDYEITQKVLHYYNISSEYIDFDMNTGLEGFAEEGRYVLRFDLISKSQGGIYFEQRFTETQDVFVQWIPNIDQADPNYLYDFPYYFEEIDASFGYSDQGNFFTIGTSSEDGGTNQEGYIDNLRVGRSDVQSCVSFEVPYTDTSGGRPDLIDGYYRFSVKVMHDPTVTPTTANRIPARSVQICLSSLGDEPKSFSTVWYESKDDNEWTEWTEIYLETDSAIQIDEPDETDTEDYTVISLSISPTDSRGGSETYDIGSILIAEPSLTYSSDGTFE